MYQKVYKLLLKLNGAEKESTNLLIHGHIQQQNSVVAFFEIVSGRHRINAQTK